MDEETITNVFMVAPLKALKAAAKILRLPIVKMKCGLYLVDAIKADKVKYRTWQAAIKACQQK